MALVRQASEVSAAFPGQPFPCEILTESETARTLRVSVATLKKHVRAGRLRRSAVSVGKSLFWAGEVRRFASTPLETGRTA